MARRRDTTRTPAAAGAARDRIVATAGPLFAHHGYAGTAIRDITRDAEVNVGAVTYHFGSKRELYHAVLRGLTEPIRSQVTAIHTSALPPLDRIERSVRAFFAHARAHPTLVPLMVREMAGADELAPPIRDMLQSALPLLAKTIADGQREGSIRAGDPVLLALSTLAQPVYLNLARKGIAAATGLDPNAPELFTRVVEHCVLTVHRALRSDGSKGTP